MKINTSELIGPALNYAVAIAIGERVEPRTVMRFTRHRIIWHDGKGSHAIPVYDQDHAATGPLIDQFDIDIARGYPGLGDKYWAIAIGSPHGASGPTRLIAACRAIVVVRLGNEVDIPDELTEAA